MLKAEGILIECVSGFLEIHQDREFAIDHSGFNALMKHSYDIQTQEVDRALQKYVSYGTWAYYHTILLWKQMYRIMGIRSNLATTNLALLA